MIMVAGSGYWSLIYGYCSVNKNTSIKVYSCVLRLLYPKRTPTPTVKFYSLI